MPLTASELVAKMELAYENLRTAILAGNAITRSKRNEIIKQCSEITLISRNQNNKYLGYTVDIQNRFEFLKSHIVMALPALKYMQIVN